MGGRVVNQDVAATRMITGADVNYGALTRNLIAYLQTLSGFAIHYSHHITHLHRDADGWRVEARDLTSGRSVSTRAKFVFLGAGGGALPLLQKSGIPEAYGYAGFPVSGSWLRTDNPEISKRHHAKVYDMASVGSPPMSVPHLDTRIIGSQRHILFGPYAGFSTRFLKHGSLLDLFIVDQARQYRALDGSRPAQFRPHRISGGTGRAIAQGPLRHLDDFLSAR